MTKSLHTLIRLHQHRVDEKRRELGGMLAVVSDLEHQADALEDKIIKEQEEDLKKEYSLIPLKKDYN